MADERDALYDIEQEIKIPFELRSCECKELSPEKRD